MDKKYMEAYPGEIYSHYKGGLVYVIGTGKDTETGQESVIYQPLLGKGDLKYGQSYVMPKEKFFAPVSGDEKKEYDQKETYMVRELGRVEETIKDQLDEQIDYWKHEARMAAQEAFDAGRRHDRQALEKIYARILEKPESI